MTYPFLLGEVQERLGQWHTEVPAPHRLAESVALHNGICGLAGGERVGLVVHRLLDGHQAEPLDRVLVLVTVLWADKEQLARGRCVSLQ